MTEALKKAGSQMAFAGALLICVGFMIADHTPALQSIGVVLIFMQPFVTGGWSAGFRGLFKNRFALGLVLYYLLILISAINTSNWHEYNRIILMQAPLVLIPFGILGIGNFTDRQRYRILVTLVLATLLAGLASLVNYIIHFAAIQESITHSKPIPIITGVNHIYYSIILAFSACIVQWTLYFKKLQKGWQSIAGFITLGILILLLHTISARTGLFCFYAEVVTSAIYLAIKTGKAILGGAILVGLGLIAVVAITTVPSIKNRLANTSVDLNKYESGQNINHYSLSMRLEALKTATEIFRKNPVFGVGPADIGDEMNAQYTIDKSQLLPGNRIKPHNQFLYTLVSLGIIGGLVLCYIIFGPFFTKPNFKNYLLLTFIIVCTAAFQAEYMLERQVGITFFALFYMMISGIAINTKTQS